MRWRNRIRSSQVSVAASSLEVEGGKTKIKVDGREDVEAITSLEEYRKKVKDDETEVESIDNAPKDKQQFWVSWNRERHAGNIKISWWK